MIATGTNAHTALTPEQWYGLLLGLIVKVGNRWKSCEEMFHQSHL